MRKAYMPSSHYIKMKIWD